MIAVLLRTSRQSCAITMADKMILFCLSASGLEQMSGGGNTEGNKSLRQLLSAKCRRRWAVAAASPQMRCGCLTGTLKHPETKSLSKLIAIVATPCARLRFALSRLTWSHLRIPESSTRGSLFCLRRFQSAVGALTETVGSLRRIKGSGEGGKKITAEGPIWIFAARRRTSFTMQAAHSNTWFWFLVSLSSLGAPPAPPKRVYKELKTASR